MLWTAIILVLIASTAADRNHDAFLGTLAKAECGGGWSGASHARKQYSCPQRVFELIAHATTAGGGISTTIPSHPDREVHRQCLFHAVHAAKTTKCSKQVQLLALSSLIAALEEDYAHVDHKSSGRNLDELIKSAKLEIKQLGLGRAKERVAPFIPYWDTVGPFPIGKSEIDGDPVEAMYGETAHHQHQHQHEGKLMGIERALESMQQAQKGHAPSQSSKYVDPLLTSELAAEGKVEWSRLFHDTQDSNAQGQGQGQGQGTIAVNFPALNWNSLVQGVGGMEVLEWQAWLVGELAVAEGGVVRVHCNGLHSVYLRVNGNSTVTLIGDQYHTGYISSSLYLTPGFHRVLIRFRAKHQGAFSCKFEGLKDDLPEKGGGKIIPSDAIKLFPAKIVPDIVDGTLLTPWISLPIANYLPSNFRLRSLKLQVEGGEPGVVVHPDSAQVKFPPLSGQVSHVPLRLAGTSHLQPLLVQSCPSIVKISGTATVVATKARRCDPDDSGRSDDEDDSGVEMELSLNQIVVTLRCRKLASESFIFTYLDHDGSVSAAGVVAPPKPCNSSSHCPVLLTLHGTGVQPGNMADSYKIGRGKSGSKFVFGVAGAWVLAPDRHGAHNWEGLGLHSALAALKALGDLTAVSSESMQQMPKKIAEFLSTRQANVAKVIMAGHSMGGHGAWVMLTRYPDLAVCGVPAAGWNVKEHYGDANRFMSLDLSASHVDFHTRALLEHSVAENAVELFSGNLVGIPMLIRVGSADQTVHPWFSRRMHRVLREANHQVGLDPNIVQLDEVSGKEHWWWDTVSTNDGGVLNDRQMRAFCTECVNKANNGSKTSSPLDRFSIRTGNPSATGPRFGVRILTTLTANLATIKASVSGSSWSFTTTNVARFSIKLGEGERKGKGSDELSIPEWAASIGPSLRLPRGEEGELKEVLVDGVLISLDVTTTTNRNSDRDRDRDTPHLVELCKHLLTWALCPSTHPAMPTTGSVRRAYDSQYLIVYPTTGDSSEMEAYYSAAVHFANLHTMASDTFSRVMSDKDAVSYFSSKATQNGGTRRENIVLFGSPSDNKLFRKLSPTDFNSTNLHFQPDGFVVAGCIYSQAKHGAMALVALLPFTLQGSLSTYIESAVVIVGTDVEGIRLSELLVRPTIPPMTRAPLTNLLPDYMLLSGEARSKGLGGVLMTGFWTDLHHHDTHRACDV